MSAEKYSFTVGDPEKDFFEQNPHWRYLDSSVGLFKDFKPEVVSMYRWAIFMILDPDSKMFRYPQDERIRVVNLNYIKDPNLGFYIDEEDSKIKHEEFSVQDAIDWYGRETMTKAKKDYYERERSYQQLVLQERESTDLKLKADVQVKLSSIYSGLEKARKEFESEAEETTIKSRGRQQPGTLFE